MKFLDTYALVAYVKGEQALSSVEDFCLLDINLAELYYSVLHWYDGKTADYFFRQFSSFVVRLPVDIIPRAMQWRKRHAKKNFSYADALGYVYAKERGLVFVTGDKAFAGMEWVELLP